MWNGRKIRTLTFEIGGQFQATAPHWNSASNALGPAMVTAWERTNMTGDHEHGKRDYLTKAVHLPRMRVSCLAQHFPSRKVDSATNWSRETAIPPVCRHRFHLDEK